MKRSILACLAGLLTWAVVVTVINRVLRLSLSNYTAAEHSLQFTLGMKWARLLMAIVTSVVAGAATGWISRPSRWAPLIVGSVVLAMFAPWHIAKPMRDNNILTRFIKPAARKLGLDFVNWRCLRTSHATWLKMVGADVKDAQA